MEVAARTQIAIEKLRATLDIARSEGIDEDETIPAEGREEIDATSLQRRWINVNSSESMYNTTNN